MKWSDFEDKMKLEAEAYEVAVDTEALWKRLKGKRKKRRALIFWWTLAGVLVLSFAIWSMRHARSQKTQVGSVAGAVWEQPSSASNTPENDQLSGERHHPARDTRILKNPGTEITVTNAAQTAGIAEKAGLPRTQMHAINPPGMERPAGPNAIFGTTTPLVKTDAPEGSALQSSALNPIPAPTSVVDWPPFDCLPIGSADPLMAPPYPFLLLSTGANAHQPKKTPTRRNIWLGVESGVGKWGASGAPQPYTAAAAGLHQPLEVVTGGLAAALPLTKRWTVGLGIQYARYSRRFTWEHTWDGQDYVYIKSHFMGGLEKIDTVQYPATYQRKVVHHNQWQQIGLPISVKYRMKTGNLGWEPCLGFQANWALASTGIQIDEDLLEPDPALFRESYRRSPNLQAFAGVDLSLHLGTQWRVTAGPVVRIDLTPRTTSGAERFYDYGLRVGLWRRF